MADWATFAGITGVVLVSLLVLSHLTQRAFDDGSDDNGSDDDSGRNVTGEPGQSASSTAGTDGSPLESTETDRESRPESQESNDSVESDESNESTSSIPVDASLEDGSGPAHGTAREPRADTDTAADVERGLDAGRPDGIDPRSLSTGELLANVAISQGLFALVLLGAVIYTGIPADALGIEFSLAYLVRGLLLGTGFGLGLYVANEVGAAAATRFGFDHDEELRELLAPDSIGGWLVLSLVVLPVIALFEELLFRAALIGVVSAGFGISPWLLAVVSSVAFAVGHGMQGSVGVVVTGLLGFALAAIFVVTGSFLVVVVAHYLVNALEFVVHEGLDFEWAETLES